VTELCKSLRLEHRVIERVLNALAAETIRVVRSGGGRANSRSGTNRGDRSRVRPNSPLTHKEG